MQKYLAVILALLAAGCAGASRQSDGAADSIRLAELKTLASDATDVRACSKIGSVAVDFKKSRVSRERTSYAFLEYYGCLEGNAALRKRRSDEIGASTQNAAVRAESARVSDSALRDAAIDQRLAEALHVPMKL